ncbi:hypothetical protein IFM89_009102 [Coptis chinensis]|uniref:CRAL/TRIO N-terminal domain-containing protein n=1 Tax=Coptis chinensis TaxID=261450 RepID=A0A835IIV8_9MAGN|nr:hypothetical protein IFM89_009102 [Coptis chinensis]
MLNTKENGGETKEDNRMKNCNEIEQQELRVMRSFVESQNPASKEVDDVMLRRFLRARDLDVKTASALFLKYLSWRQEYVPKGSISESDIPNELAQKKMFLQGYDKQERPIAVVLGKMHIPNKRTGGLDEFKSKFLSYSIYLMQIKMCLN